MVELSRAIAVTVAALAASAVILFTLASAVAESIESPIVATATAASTGSWRGEAKHGVRLPVPTDSGATARASLGVAQPGSSDGEPRLPAARARPPPPPLAAAYLAHLEYMLRHPGTGPDDTEAHRQTWLTEARGTGAKGRASRDRELEKMLRFAGWREADSPAGLQVGSPHYVRKIKTEASRTLFQ
jgi:hypothetical protein